MLSLRYKNISKDDELMRWTSSAMYGGHLARFGLRPPTYLLNVDCMIVDDRVERGLVNLIRAIKLKKSVYFHLDLSKEGALRGLSEKKLNAISEELSNLDFDNDSIMFLPSCAKMFRTYSAETSESFYTYIYDAGFIHSDYKSNKMISRIQKEITSQFKRERMIWTPKELPGSPISFLWSKRIIYPELILDNCLTENERELVKKSNQMFSRRLK